MKVECPECQRILVAPDDLMGRRVRCKHCGHGFNVLEEHQILEVAKDGLCPRCRAPIQPAAVSCGQCGQILTRGPLPPARPVPIPTPRPSATEETRSATVRVLESVGALFPGFFRPGVFIGASIVALISFGVLGLGIFIVSLGALLEGIFIGAFGLIFYAQALAMILQGEWGMLSSLLAEFDGARWTVFFILLAAPMVAIYLLIGFISR
jgi:predicted Zn finger-like uncharacterized protein